MVLLALAVFAAAVFVTAIGSLVFVLVLVLVVVLVFHFSSSPYQKLKASAFKYVLITERLQRVNAVPRTLALLYKADKPSKLPFQRAHSRIRYKPKAWEILLYTAFLP